MRADRLLSLLLLLQAHGRLSAPEIARRLEVSTRTVYRDMDALSAAGVPVYAERGRTGGCALLPGFRTDVTGLTASEAQALFVLTGGQALADLGLGAEVRSALRKLSAGLPASVRPDADRLARRVVVDQHGWRRQRDDDPWLAQLHAAVLADRQVRLRYRGREGVERCVVDPWGLVVKAGVWYLVAAEGGETRLFRVSRVEEAVQTDEVARRPRALDLDAEWTRLRRQVEEMYGSPVAVELRVRDDTLALLERVCGRHLVQGGPRPVPDGEGWHRMALEFPVLGAARARLLGFGDAVEVLTPPELREEMHDVAAGVVRLYAGVDVHPG